MKVERNVEFVPVTSTLTTQAEVDMVVALLGGVRFDKADECGIDRGLLKEAFSIISKYVKNKYSSCYFTG